MFTNKKIKPRVCNDFLNNALRNFINSTLTSISDSYAVETVCIIISYPIFEQKYFCRTPVRLCFVNILRYGATFAKMPCGVHEDRRGIDTDSLPSPPVEYETAGAGGSRPRPFSTLKMYIIARMQGLSQTV